jgi:hypothetical protein
MLAFRKVTSTKFISESLSLISESVWIFVKVLKFKKFKLIRKKT